MTFKVTVVTLFPDMFPGMLGQSIMGRAMKSDLWELDIVDIRQFGTGKHKSVDDTPYGGGAGMVMRADVVAEAIRKAKEANPTAPVIYMSAAGEKFTAAKSHEMAKLDGVILLCGHYEGIDQRVLDSLVDFELSIGDYVLSGGEVAVHVVVDAVLRHIPGVLGNHDTLSEESFENGLLEYPHYTRPESWEGRDVPEVLRSGHHANIEKWRSEQSLKRTKERRPDLLKSD
ncbi:MAG: tRNA (guanosine(37)-N1)-methyltransferase TrmD [Pseudomonadota bacterium]|nr:tRNA (guanosine(37)-N1)-methyltransferase TrmD [Pseudomonadota bacterium]